ncbi:DUF1016 domain-containing protein [Xylella taiwanensis]|uniref:DUF1016 domain-containing protein n=1 Tax=Xylella taiwanensis TaxID=1444770 RepID=Z9JKX7_9GAMM|nr:PDDEXK nuclease domain-containing protein [Xylella taiwanensis]EWS78486.1 hypothetical protein AF72_05415 [Xylella taiwanensis]MCD8455959.1 DUF1016 domain-containing protein [Xylella taiwanensis]MCD8458362.1 DUF1016 domain-containing protein [Xylella taiwanensis]MCD8460501.1 DUF1016 domain-containing protein [Xylella taiwanensis]MCD8463440.1 DUF1016 domain-containing protein [Xylella taiwanensis]
MLFYRRKLRQRLVMELKIVECPAAYQGQMALYLRWLHKHRHEPEEAVSLGIICCVGKKCEWIGLLQLDTSSIHVAEFLTNVLSCAVQGAVSKITQEKA